MLMYRNGTPRWPLDTFLLKMSNTSSLVTLERNALLLQNLAQIYSLETLYKCENVDHVAN